MTPSFALQTLEGRKVLAFARDIRLGLLPSTVMVKPEWISPGEVTIPRAVDMEALMSHPAPGHPQLSSENPRPDTVSVTRMSLAPLSLVNLLMVSPF